MSKKLQHRTARRFVSHVGTVERFLIRKDLHKAMTVSNAVKGLPIKETKPVRVFTSGEVAQLMQSALVHHKWWSRRRSALMACYVHIAACCGLRLGEICGLRWEDVDADGLTIRVRQAINDLREVRGPKTAAGVRDVAMPPHLSEMLRLWRERYAVDNPGGLVFTRLTGGAMSHSEVHSSWRRLLVAAGLEDDGPRFHFHALRHFAGSWWLSNGMELVDASKMLGHSNPSITLKIYTHSMTSTAERRALAMQSSARLLGLTDARVPQQAG